MSSTPSRVARCRPHDVVAIVDLLAVGQPVAVVGLSNFGKSTLMRQMVEPKVGAAYRDMTGREALFVYVDCNRMLEMSAQGLYEAILRAILEALTGDPGQAALSGTLTELYGKVVESRSTFAIPLAFNDAIIALLEDPAQRDVILLLDEFDDVLTGLEERVFLNFRALKDKYTHRLNYAIATLRPPSAVGGGDNLNEFLELFAAQKYHLKPLSPEDAAAVAAEIFEQAGDHLDPWEREFILAQAGGHPGLIRAASHVVMEVESGVPATYTQQALDVASDVCQNHPLVRGELSRLWQHLLPHEREAATQAAAHGIASLSDDQRSLLVTRGLLVESGTSARLFADLFAHYARRQGLVHHNAPQGVWIDVDAGTAQVNGRVVDSLTDLEYRLLLLLYGRVDKICDKYQIVEAVWGQDYLGEVDDARVEKLVSRLRAKLEPDPANPRYIITVRGRGYKLDQGGSLEE